MGECLRRDGRIYFICSEMARSEATSFRADRGANQNGEAFAVRFVDHVERGEAPKAYKRIGPVIERRTKRG